jgi:hypothetical protein
MVEFFLAGEAGGGEVGGGGGEAALEQDWRIGFTLCFGGLVVL